MTHLRKLIWPLGPVRTVIPEVPVEPAVLGAGLGREVVESLVTSPVVLMAKRYPFREIGIGEETRAIVY